ncbi:transcriptional regulator, LysR family (plasmid) [Rhizobium leguminosarum bv. trifolii WSM2304]|uniref:Transcriptional regulator, LysR family n=1 Tax=Rhizobium leguminosarum bv. trifolii (strain WSM2304) TaxID=395492 RepID=A0ABF7QVV1_RHILW|nr:LysR family transcriptional regulator [Rhizobium leguminosarum]ACI58280.1 transcriptional regulator, LysR family [Rhizobium leguminosarum bv. trifolii WSM2304]
MLNYLALEALDAIIRAGSFENAAEALHISPSAVSQRIAKLERHVSARLVIRGTPCRATDEGALLIQHLEKVRLMESELAEHAPEIAFLCKRENSLNQRSKPDQF